MGGAIIVLRGGPYYLSIWEFETKDCQINIMKATSSGELDYYDTIVMSKEETVDDLLYIAIKWLKDRNLSWEIVNSSE